MAYSRRTRNRQGCVRPAKYIADTNRPTPAGLQQSAVAIAGSVIFCRVIGNRVDRCLCAAERKGFTKQLTQVLR